MGGRVLPATAEMSIHDENARRDSRQVDPNRRHMFVVNDLTTACYRCDQRDGADIHDGPWKRRELAPGYRL